ncbi:MAG: tetratricopeptide repeat protein [Fimbriimonadales bacterium]|nr:tetratricopeptide repeat protein [Fimbriimonadales bacterium]
MSVNGKTDVSAQAERLMREAMSLYEQGRLEEALLACEGALALDEKYAPALSLKGLIHERRGQISDAIAAYERVQAVNPLSVSERARLEALRRQSRAAVRPVPARPLWMETMPVVLAFLGAGIILLVGLALILRWTAPAPEPARVAASPEPIESRPSPPQPSVPPPTSEAPAQNANPQTVVPPVMVDPSRVALAPAETPPPPRSEIPTLPAPENNAKTDAKPPTPPPATAKPSSDGEVMPDVKVEETQRGVYEIRVQRVGEGQTANRAANRPASDPLTQAQNYQRAGNYREAIQAYLQALPNASNPAEVHQQIATCYLRLGDKANARLHFQQAIVEYERQIQSGRDVEAARQGIAACQNGLLLCNE